MKITITQDFDTAEEAADFIARVTGPVKGVDAHAPQAQEPAPTEKPARKPRADAGQKREPYGPRTTEANAAGAGAQGENPAGAPGGSPAAPAAAASPQPAAPTPPAPAPAQKAEPKVEDFPPTLEGARDAMKLLSNAPGKGTEACILALREFGVNRISEVKPETPERYKALIAHILASLPKAK